MTSDAHLHLVECTDTGAYPWTSRPDLVFTCTARPSEWGRFDGAKNFYGVHPWYNDEWNDVTKGKLVSLLESDPRAGIGEIGLDDSRGDVEEQVHVFEEQLEIASEFQRTVTAHMVGCERQMLESLRRCGGGVPVVLHAFKSESYVKPFAELNCYFSIGPRVLTKSQTNIKRIVSAIPEDRLLVETDTPHMPKGFTGIDDVLSKISETIGVTVDEVSRITTENLRRID